MKSKERKPRNKFELKIHAQLKRKKVKFKYEADRISYIITGHYIPDFTVQHSTGPVYIETKGYFRPEAKRKLVAVKKLHPAIDIRIVFYSRRPADIRWAEKHGFLWAVGSVPKEWLDVRQD